MDVTERGLRSEKERERRQTILTSGERFHRLAVASSASRVDPTFEAER
jgi:hypothetical protein